MKYVPPGNVIQGMASLSTAMLTLSSTRLCLLMTPGLLTLIVNCILDIKASMSQNIFPTAKLGQNRSTDVWLKDLVRKTDPKLNTQSPPKVLDQEGQLNLLCCALETLVCEIKRRI